MNGFAKGDAIDLGGVAYASGEHMVWLSTANDVQTFALESAANSVLRPELTLLPRRRPRRRG